MFFMTAPLRPMVLAMHCRSPFTSALDGYISASFHHVSHLGLGDSWRVVDAISGHRDLPLLGSEFFRWLDHRGPLLRHRFRHRTPQRLYSHRHGRRKEMVSLDERTHETFHLGRSKTL